MGGAVLGLFYDFSFRLAFRSTIISIFATKINLEDGVDGGLPETKPLEWHISQLLQK